MQKFAVGEKWPYPLGHDGLGIMPSLGEDGLDLVFSIALSQPTANEIEAIRKGPLKIGLLLSPPIVWFVLSGDKISMECAYAPGLEGAMLPPDHLAAAAKARDWPVTARRSVMVCLADTETGRTEVLRLVTLTRAWWVKLAFYLEKTYSPVTQQQHMVAMHNDMTRYSTTADMLKKSGIVERAGAI